MITIQWWVIPLAIGFGAALSFSAATVWFSRLLARFFALLAPASSTGNHLKALARISRLFKNPRFRQSILEARTSEEIYRLIVDEDARA